MKEKRIIGGDVFIKDQEDSPVIEGYAAVWDVITEIWQGYYEVIRRGAFARSLSQSPDVRALFNHDPNIILGRTKNNTLELSEDERGLKYRITVNPADKQAVDVHEKIKRGDVSQSSFAFEIDGKGEGGGEQFTNYKDGKLREIIRAKLYDVSPVTYPAYELTEAQARSIFNGLNSEQDAPKDSISPEPVLHLIRARARMRLADYRLKKKG